MVYFGISITRSASPTFAWQDSRERLQAPGLVEQVVLVFLRRRERVEALAHDDVAGGAGAGLLAGVLDLDAVLEQVVADRLALARLEGLPSGQSSACGRTTISASAVAQARAHRRRCRPRQRACATLRSMRRAANSSVARLSASTAALMRAAIGRPSPARRSGRDGAARSRRAPAASSRSPSARERALGRLEQALAPRPAPRPARARAMSSAACVEGILAACARCRRRPGRRKA